MESVNVPALEPSRFEPIIGEARAQEFAAALSAARRQLDGRTLWHVNSTAEGGGVAEILVSAVGYLAGAEIPTCWAAMDADGDFFAVTKRLHHLLHGEPGDGGRLGDEERSVYESCASREGERLLAQVAPGDPVVLHDPQTLGLAPGLRAAGVPLIWSCHVGADTPNDLTRQAWDFLRPYLDGVPVVVFSRQQYAWEGIDPDLVAVVPPCVDAFSPKNQPMDRRTVDAILAAAGLLPPAGDPQPAVYRRADGAAARVSRAATFHETSELDPTTPVVSQVSRWDRLKDHAGLLRAFVDHVAPRTPADLVLAGPSPDAVDDDPEGLETYRRLVDDWRSLPAEPRARVHIACLPMDDAGENAAIVNALQRRSDVVVQKSLAEGFGLTVAEAMLKGRPVVGSRVGGIQDQIEHQRSGVLVDDPTDLPAFGREIGRLLADPAHAARLGQAAADRVLDEYLMPGFLTRYLRLVGRVLASRPAGPALRG